MRRLGDQVDVYCGKCKVERYHTVAALGDGGRIERVVCGYCHTPRKYKDPAAAPRRQPTAASTSTRRRTATPAIDPSEPSRAFSPRDTYQENDVIVHAKYGRGRVVAVRGDRIDVRFVDSTLRTFLHTPSE
jgi:mono/diheme cytochrome c family protein